MPSVVIIGNITKDVYLRLDGRNNSFEEDANGVNWLDLAFNGGHHDYFSRVSIYGGASISLEVLSRFGLHANISNAPASFIDGQFVTKDAYVSYRYILCQNESTCHLCPSEPLFTKWEVPSDSPDWIYIDSSAIITPKLSSEILNYLSLSKRTKLAFYVGKSTNPNTTHIQELITRADFVISNIKLKNRNDYAFIANNYISYNGHRVDWTLQNKKDLMTRFSSHLTIAASLFGAIALDKSPDEALLLARANAENSKLSNTTNLSALENKIMNDYYRIKQDEPKGEK